MTREKISVFPDVRALIFDCDGTLADTMPFHIQAWHDVFVEIGEVPHQEFLDPLKGLPEERIVALYNQRYGKTLDVLRVVEDKQRRFRKSLPRVRPIRPVVEVARRHAGRLPMAVVSGGTRDNVLLTLEIIGVAPLFPVVLTADDEFPPKPAPDLFLEAARRLRISPGECQVFEDGDLGLEAARSAGMIAFDVRPVLGSG